MPETPHVGPPDLILKEIVAPSDVPSDVRGAVIEALARVPGPNRVVAPVWENVTFAGRALALVEGTDQPAFGSEELNWVFALKADHAEIGQQIHSDGHWTTTIMRVGFVKNAPRHPEPVSLGFRGTVYDSVKTEPAART